MNKNSKDLELQNFQNSESSNFSQNSSNEELKTNNSLNSSNSKLGSLLDVPLRISVVLGSTKMTLAKVMNLREGFVVELDQKVGNPVQIFANDKLIANGEIVLVDERIAVSIVEIIKK